MAIIGATQILINDRNCQCQYVENETPKVATINNDVACQGIRLSIIVP
jgi:hypothetical protein